MKKLIICLFLLAMATGSRTVFAQAISLGSENTDHNPLVFKNAYVDRCGDSMSVAALRDSIANAMSKYVIRRSDVSENKLVYCVYPLPATSINAEHEFRIAMCTDQTYIPTLRVPLSNVVFLDVNCKEKYVTFMFLPNSSVCSFFGSIEEARIYLLSSLKPIRVVDQDGDDFTQNLRKMNFDYLYFALTGIYCKDRKIEVPKEFGPQAGRPKE